MTPEQILDDTLYQLKQFTLLAKLTDGQRKRLKEIISRAQQFATANTALASQPVPAPDLVERDTDPVWQALWDLAAQAREPHTISRGEMIDAAYAKIIPIVREDEREIAGYQYALDPCPLSKKRRWVMAIFPTESEAHIHGDRNGNVAPVRPVYVASAALKAERAG